MPDPDMDSRLILRIDVAVFALIFEYLTHSGFLRWLLEFLRALAC
jgi:hypothetical protein